jgi:hypothetical protein
MFKKILLIATLCISLMAIMGMSANAAPPFPGGWAWTPGSTSCYSLWKSVNPWLLEEGGEYDFDIECTAVPVEAESVCVNHGGNIGGSFRFYPIGGDQSREDNVELPDLLKGGRVISEGTITDMQWYEALFCPEGFNPEDVTCNGNPPEEVDGWDFSAACHNHNNWWVLPPGWEVDGVEGYVKITRLHGRITGYLDGWEGGGPDDNIIGQIESIGDLNKKEDGYDWDFTYFWSLKKNGLPMYECEWCIDPIEY